MHKSLKDKMKDGNYHLVSIDLFSGPGGLCTGFKWAGILPLIAVEWTNSTVLTYSHSHDAEILELSECIVDGKINKEYFKKFKKESIKSLIIHGDINLVSSDLIKTLLKYRYGIDSDKETVDIVSGGAPCESFSMAGTRTANDKRDDLFSNILRISRTLKTKMILFENVKGMLSKPKDGVKGAIFEYICNSFEDTNASVQYRLVSRNPNEIVLRACDYGVPQNRERLFLVGIRKDLENLNFTYPDKEYGPGTDKQYVTVWDAISDLPLVESGDESITYNFPSSFSNENQKRYVSIMRGIYHDEGMNTNVPQHLINENIFNQTTISAHKGPGHTPRKKELLALIKEEESMRITFSRLVIEGTLEKYRHLFPNIVYGSRNRRLIKTKQSFTVTSHCMDELLHPVLNRAITPREAARLQSFPDWYQFEGPYVIFHSAKEQDKYEQIGDAIPPLLAFAIGRQFVSCLKQFWK